jgi:hypothetical protein
MRHEEDKIAGTTRDRGEKQGLKHIQKGLSVTKPAEIDLPAGRHRISLLLIGSICLGDVTVELEEGK